MPSLSESDRHNLLLLARNVIVRAVTHHQLLEAIPRDGIFAEQRGVFVTVHVSGHLRGCIGTTAGSEPLADAIVRCAASAALHDPRFAPMRVDELGGLEVEVSVLSPLFRARPEEIRIGRHGLVISDQGHRGLLLPQVAVERRFSPEQFLAETCQKAGLPREAWRWPGTTILGFTCEVFSEHPRKAHSAPISSANG
jgi:AmmeMemoRadiSam system protein A